jgi:cell filamentation protein
MASADDLDPYLDPATGILRNLVGATTEQQLSAAEADLSSARLLQLLAHPPKPTRDLDEVRAIHRALFQDVYPWAGQVRLVDLRRRTEGAEPFLAARSIDRGSMFFAAELRRDNMLRGLNRDQFVQTLPYHYSNLNYIHPFREGNGRAQRVFWSLVARDAGWQLDWRRVRGEVNDRASQAGREQQEFGPLVEMFDGITTAADRARTSSPEWRLAEAAHLGVGQRGPGTDTTTRIRTGPAASREREHSDQPGRRAARGPDVGYDR